MTKLGIVGCGYWGAKHLRSLYELGKCELAACDASHERLASVQRRYPAVATTERYEDMLEWGVDGVVVATPISTHYDLAREALLRGKDVLVEKPLTMDVQQAEKLVELAERQSAVLMVGHTFLYNPAVQAVLDLIARGDLGDVYYLDAARLNLGLFQHDANVLWDLAPHDLSIILYLLGQDPVQVSARGASHLNGRVCDNAYLDLAFASGAHAHVHVSWLEPCKARRTTVVGSRKMVVYDDVSPTDKVWVYDKGINLHYDTDAYDDFHLSYRYGNTTILHTPSDEPLQSEQLHFLDCIVERRRPTSDGFLGLKVTRLLECAQRSLDAGGAPIEVGELLPVPEPWLGTGLDLIAARREPPAHENGVAADPVGEWR